MQLDHERLDVYDLALEFLVLVNGIIEGLPRGRSHLADQFTRALLSIVLNLAEGAGQHSKLDKRRYYVTARGSATESAGLLVAMCAIDNLSRGASAQALQAFNVSQGWADGLGLPELPLFP